MIIRQLYVCIAFFKKNHVFWDQFLPYDIISFLLHIALCYSVSNEDVYNLQKKKIWTAFILIVYGRFYKNMK